MSEQPVIAFGQQPCGFLPRRYLVAKVRTARRLQAEIGGEIVYFCHDSDHDPRETRTILRHRKTHEPAVLNFAVDNKVQRKYSPLCQKRIAPDWQAKTALQLPNYLDHALIDHFNACRSGTVADFCLEMYARIGLLDGLRVVRSGDPACRLAACDVADFFVDVPYQGELVRARHHQGQLQLHEGGDSFIQLPPSPFGKEQISPTRDSRLRWMQSIIRCTHYIAGAGEQAYLSKDQAPEITFVPRDFIDRAEEAYDELSI